MRQAACQTYTPLGQLEDTVSDIVIMAPSVVPLPDLHHEGRRDVDLAEAAVERAAEDPQQLKARLRNGHGQGPLATITPSPLSASRLVHLPHPSPRAVPPQSAIDTAPPHTETICTDHMVVASWHVGSGWSAPELRPYGPLSLMPTTSVLHYATECFEGLKAYRGSEDGKLRLFRPELNCARMVRSAERVSLPGFEPEELLKLIVKLLAVDGPKWLPRPTTTTAGSGGSAADDKDSPPTHLYLRPTLFGSSPCLGVQTPSQATLLVLAALMPRVDKPGSTTSNLGGGTGGGGMRLITSPENMVRAWVGGFGSAKVGANYGPSLPATHEARLKGYTQVLWLYGPEGHCTEAGASNFFVVWRTKEEDGGRVQIVTAPLDDGIILDGVTRRSVLELARERLVGSGDDDEHIEVVERRYTIQEVLDAHKEGRILEAFASGTAVSRFSNPKSAFSLSVMLTMLFVDNSISSVQSRSSTTVVKISRFQWVTRAQEAGIPSCLRAGYPTSCTDARSTRGLSLCRKKYKRGLGEHTRITKLHHHSLTVTAYQLKTEHGSYKRMAFYMLYSVRKYDRVNQNRLLKVAAPCVSVFLVNHV